MKTLLFAFAALLGFLNAALSQSLPAPSFWENQRKSTLAIYSVDSGGAIRGEFVNQAAGFECQGIPYPVVGRVFSSKLFFVVTFAKCNSVTIWRGSVTASTIATKWTLRYVKPDGTIGILNGKDTFTRLRP